MSNLQNALAFRSYTAVDGAAEILGWLDERSRTRRHDEGDCDEGEVWAGPCFGAQGQCRPNGAGSYFSRATTNAGAHSKARLISESGKVQIALRADPAYCAALAVAASSDP